MNIHSVSDRSKELCPCLGAPTPRAMDEHVGHLHEDRRTAVESTNKLTAGIDAEETGG